MKEKMIDYQLDMSIEDAVRIFNYVGCVYPDNEESYYIDSNIQVDLVPVYCEDGYFYGDYEAAKDVAYKEYFVEYEEPTKKPKIYDGFEGDYDFDEIEE